MPRGPEPKKPRPAWSTALRSRRVALDLRQEDVAARTEDAISQGTISDLERGKVDIRNLTAPRLGALASALGWTPQQMEEALGVKILRVVDTDMSWLENGPVVLVDQKKGLSRTLPHGLQEAVELYGKRYSDLQDTTWQNYLAGFRWREGEPEEPEAWLDLYRDLVRAGVVPGSN